MLDPEALKLREELLSQGDIIDALSIPIIPWGSLCCDGCEFYECGKSITAHGYCPIEHRKVSPHYYCEKWEQD